MALCTKCLPLQTIALAEIKAPEKGLQHHETYASLKDAALNGCQLCVMFRQALLHAHELQFSWSEDEAEASYTEWDRQVGNIFKIMGVYRAFYGKSSQSDCHALQIIRPHQPHVVEKETGFSVSLWWPLLRLTTAAGKSWLCIHNAFETTYLIRRRKCHGCRKCHEKRHEASCRF